MPDYQVGPLLVSDSFNRADGAIGSTDGGILGPLAYQADGATSLASWEVAGNKAQSNHAGTALQPIWIDVGVSDYRIEIEVAALPGFGANIGVVGRYVDRSSLIWWGVNESGTLTPQRLYLQQRPTTADVDAINLVGPIGGLTAPGDVITVDFWGSDVYIYKNGSPLADVHGITFNQTATKVGLWGNKDGTGALDNFKVWRLLPPSTWGFNLSFGQRGPGL